MDFETLLTEAQKPETVAALNGLAARAGADAAGSLVAVMPMVHRIGHLGPEPHFLMSLFGDRYSRLAFVTGPSSLPGVNRALFDLVRRHVPLLATQHPVLLGLGALNQGVVPTGTYDLYLAAPARFYRDYTRHRIDGGTLRHLALTPALADRGRRWLARLGIDASVPLVAVHMRHGAYAVERGRRQAADLRTVSNASFRPAIDWLVEQGYAVARIGDAASPPLDHPSPLVIDVPRLAGSGDWIDVFVCGHCRLSLNCMSGPEGLLRGFGRPSVNTNVLPTVFAHHLPGDRFLFRTLRQRDRPDPLGYAEMLAAGLPARQVSGPLPDAAFYEAGGYRFEENSAEQVLSATQDMVRSLDGAAPSAEDEVLQARFRAMSRTYQAALAADEAAARLSLDLYTHAHDGFGRLAAGQLLVNPEFLD
jgi:putative glycosyltransferase (TIGR04372 family)